MTDDEKPIKIGALWNKKDKNGNTYLSGKLSGNILIFPNSYKEKENQPDHFIMARSWKNKEDESDHETDSNNVSF